MALQQQDLEVITEHIQKAFPALLEGSASVTMHPSQSAYWLERIAKIEEELTPSTRNFRNDDATNGQAF